MSGTGGKDRGPPRPGSEVGYAHASGEVRSGVGAIPSRVLAFPSRDESGPRPPPPPPPPDPVVSMQVVRLTGDGTVKSGEAPASLTELVAYTAQLADLVGDLIGAGPFASIEMSLTEGSCVVARASDGDLLAGRAGRGVEVATLRQRLVQGDGK